MINILVIISLIIWIGNRCLWKVVVGCVWTKPHFNIEIICHEKPSFMLKGVNSTTPVFLRIPQDGCLYIPQNYPSEVSPLNSFVSVSSYPSCCSSSYSIMLQNILLIPQITPKTNLSCLKKNQMFEDNIKELQSIEWNLKSR